LSVDVFSGGGRTNVVDLCCDSCTFDNQSCFRLLQVCLPLLLQYLQSLFECAKASGRCFTVLINLAHQSLFRGLQLRRTLLVQALNGRDATLGFGRQRSFEAAYFGAELGRDGVLALAAHLRALAHDFLKIVGR
jgi:hypothetical protein